MTSGSISSRFCALTATCALMFLSGCASWFPWSAERLATTQRVAERCTSISNVIGKNYQVSGKLNLFGNGAGGGWSQTGVQLSAEAAERQMQMDRLCRAWAVGAITDEKWSDTYIQFALASIAPLARSDSPEAATQLKAATEALAAATIELAKVRSESTYNPNEDSTKLNAGIDRVAKSTESLEDMHRGLDTAYAGTGLPTGKDPREAGSRDTTVQLEALRSDLGTNQRAVLEVLGAVKGRIETVERKLEQGPEIGAFPGLRSWQERSLIKAYFAAGKFDLSPEAKKSLDAQFTGQYPRELRVEVVGHTDTSGNSQKNAALSLARAQEVRDYLIVERRVPATAVVTIGRQNSTSSFGPLAENRVVTVRVFENSPKSTTELGPIESGPVDRATAGTAALGASIKAQAVAVKPVVA